MTRRLARLSLALLAVFLLLASARGGVFAQQPTLEDVLAKAAQYVAAFTDPSRALVCEEAYEHTYYRRMMNTGGGSERVPQNTRRWVAEKVVLATPVDEKAGFPWIEFRDIVSLDRKPARDGVSRLPALLIEPKVPDVAAAMTITRESTNTQAGRLERMVLLPRLTSVFLHAANQPRFTFTKGGSRTIQGVKTMEVKFQEKGAPTIVKTGSGQDAPSSGSLWIDPATGAVLGSFLKNGDSSALYDELTTSYALDQATSLWLPVSLVEKMYDSQDEKEIDGKGTFKNWRFAPRGK
jgi:hypothetical protein